MRTLFILAVCLAACASAPEPLREPEKDCSPPNVNGFRLKACAQDFDQDREVCIYEGQGQIVGLLREGCQEWEVIGVQPIEPEEEKIEL